MGRTVTTQGRKRRVGNGSKENHRGHARQGPTSAGKTTLSKTLYSWLGRLCRHMVKPLTSDIVSMYKLR